MLCSPCRWGQRRQLRITTREQGACSSAGSPEGLTLVSLAPGKTVTPAKQIATTIPNWVPPLSLVVLITTEDAFLILLGTLYFVV